MCTSLGQEEILYEDECRTASQAMGMLWGGSETASDYPKGCYIFFTGRNGEMYWNNDALGSRDRISASVVCKNCKGQE